MTDDEEFFAWLDGELPQEAAERVAARVAASPELTALADQHRTVAGHLRHAFQPVMEATIEPPRFSAEVIDFGAKATARERRWFAVPQWAAMAASLALGLVLGSQFIDRGGAGSPVGIESGRMVAAASLDQVLDQRLASAPEATGPRVGLTFRNAAGSICRSFTDAAMSGLACREGDEWHIRGLFQGGEGQGADYRMAAGEDPRLVALIDETISGEPFDAAQERAAREQGWR